MRIGIDFGMTNSTISHYDDAKRNTLEALVSFRPDAATNEYIPSIITYNKTGNISIGNVAKANATKQSVDAYENFKLHLGRNFNDPIAGKSKTPNEVTSDYIRELLELFKSKHRKGNKIEYIVMTVPEIWTNEKNNRVTRDNLQDIFEQLGYFDVQLVSEPAAAAAYFCHAHQLDLNSNPSKSGYSGDLVVVDYGGGTLDVTLCRVANSKITILERCGSGEDEKTKGCAGVAFDEAVVEKLIKDNNLAIKLGSIQFVKLRNKFEELKRLEVNEIRRQLEYYFSGPEGPEILEGEVLFSIECGDDGQEINVTCEDLAESFRIVNAPVLVSALNEINRHFAKYKTDSASQENFKVLLVGGFCNFYAVEAEVRKFFKSKTWEEDARFVQPFELIDRSFAISKGAALIAKDLISVEQVCPYDIGYIMITGDEHGNSIKKDVVVIRRGESLSDSREVKFSGIPITLYSAMDTFEVFIDDKDSKSFIRQQATLRNVANSSKSLSHSQNSVFKIGFSVNRNLIPTIHIKNENEDTVHLSLNKLMDAVDS